MSPLLQPLLQRAAGALVVIADGKLLGYLPKGGKKLTTFLAENEPDRGKQAKQLADALVERAATRHPVMIERVDGDPPENSVLAPALAEAGFLATVRGLVHRG